jgi:GxxExxY protein
MKAYQPLSAREEEIGRLIVDAAYAVHKTLGPGLLEHVCELCFCHEIGKRGLAYKRQVAVPIIYDGITFQEALRLDVVVEDLVICEIKTVEAINQIYISQLATYLKLTQRRLGFLINFNVPLIKSGIKRVIF